MSGTSSPFDPVAGRLGRPSATARLIVAPARGALSPAPTAVGRERLRDARLRSSGPEREPDPGRLPAVRLMAPERAAIEWRFAQFLGEPDEKSFGPRPRQAARR